MSKQFNLNREDLKKWFRNVLIFSAPAVIAFLTVLQTGGNFELAEGMFYQAIIASCIDLARKFISDNKV